MRILSLTYEYPPLGGGGGVVARALNERFVAAGDSVNVVTSRMRGLPKVEVDQGVTVHRTACVRRHPHFSTAAELATTLLPSYAKAAELIEAERPDVIHAHFAVPTGVVARRLSRRYGIPYVLTAHGSDIPGYNPDRFSLLHRLLRPHWRRVVDDAAALVSPSRYLVGLMRSAGLTRHVDVIPNGYTPARESQVSASGQADAAAHGKKSLALVVSRLFPRKGVQHFVEALTNLGEEAWEFAVAGDGPYLEALQAQALRTHAPVRFLGFLAREPLRQLYQDAEIFVFPSIRENFPMVLLEAMEAGCAVITTDAEGCAEVVGDAGIVVPAGSSDAVRCALVALMADPVRRRELGERARRRVERFRWDLIGESYRQVFRRSVADPYALPTLTLDHPIPAAQSATGQFRIMTPEGKIRDSSR
jgi:glycosyltransferase involved in cell wall biosynthesis